MNLAAIIDPHPDDAVALVNRGRTPPTASCASTSPACAAASPAWARARRPRRASSAATTGISSLAYLAVARRGRSSPCPSTRRARPQRARPRAGCGGRAAPRSSADQLGRSAVDGIDPDLAVLVARNIGSDAGALLDARARPTARSSTASRATSPCSCSRAAPPARRRRRCSRTATCSRTSSRCRRTDAGAAAPTTSCSACCRCSTSSGSTWCSG